MILRAAAAVFIGYIIGSINFAILISNMVQKNDVRRLGSGNAGATNMARSFGIISGLTTMLCDMAKAALAIYLGQILTGDAGIAFGGISCLIGHCYPLFYGFRGGKGVAVGAIVVLFASPRAFAAVIIIFAAVALMFRKVSLASICATVSAVVIICLSQCSLYCKISIVIAATIIIVRHRQNIQRLISGTESDFVIRK